MGLTKLFFELCSDTQYYDLRVMSKARKVLVNLALRCICWYIWCAQFFDFVNLCDFGSFLVSCVPILSPICLDCKTCFLQSKYAKFLKKIL